MAFRSSTAGLIVAGLLLAQSPGLDMKMFRAIHDEAYDHSRAEEIFEMLTVNIGPRLTASPAHQRAAEFTRERLASFGLANARLEPWQFGRGWTMEKLTIEMVEPRYLPLLGYAD